MDGKFLVAYGMEEELLEDLPLIPDFLIVRKGDGFWRLNRTGEANVGPEWYQRVVQAGLVRALSAEVPWEDGSWAIVEEDEAVLFPMGEEEQRRAKRAQELVGQATSTRGDPEKALSMLRAAGGLARIPLAKLIIRLESMRERRDESLVDIYRRSK